MDIFVTDENEICFTSREDKYISCLSPSDSESIVFSSDPLGPWGICQTKDGGLLVTLEDTETDIYQLKSHSRLLVRHVTLTGDVIHDTRRTDRPDC